MVRRSRPLMLCLAAGCASHTALAQDLVNALRQIEAQGRWSVHHANASRDWQQDTRADLGAVGDDNETQVREVPMASLPVSYAWMLQCFALVCVIACAATRGPPKSWPLKRETMRWPGQGHRPNPLTLHRRGPAWHDEWYDCCQDPRRLGMGCCCPCVIWADNLHHASIGNGWWFDFITAVALCFSNLLIPVPMISIATCSIFMIQLMFV
eukprot:5924186-Amphidinium_carterae.1